MTNFGDVDLSSVKGLEDASHRAPSTIGIDTIYRSQGKIPEAFLQGCGVPEDFIQYMPSLFGAEQVIQFYSYFISYSTEDEEFAKRLHSRMRDEKLRAWFAPEDIKGGRTIYEQIESAIRLHDKLLLVLSEDSINRNWVVTEIRAALDAEKDGKQKLFPIRLTGLENIKHWKLIDSSGRDLAEEIFRYFIPDFSNWKDHDSFEAAFTRLPRDLNAAETKG